MRLLAPGHNGISTILSGLNFGPNRDESLTSSLARPRSKATAVGRRVLKSLTQALLRHQPQRNPFIVDTIWLAAL